MKKKIEEAVDEIIKLYYSGVSIGFAYDSIVKQLNTDEQYELIRLLKKAPRHEKK